MTTDMEQPSSRTTRSHSQAPLIAASGSHTRFHSAKPAPMDSLQHSESSTLVMVQEDGHCELSMDGGSYVVDYQNTPIMGTHAPPRFVAGQAFFNYELYGGLRRGGSISLFAPAFRGYALAAFLSGYVYTVVMYLVLRLPDRALFLDDASRLKNVLSLQWSVVLVVGLVSDSYAPFGRRRRPYMLAGWTLASLLWLGLFLLFQCASSPPPHATTLLLVLAFLAQIVATNAMDIRVIELSQQEELQCRGQLLGTYEAVRIGAQLVVHSLIAIIVSPDTKTLDVHLPIPTAYVFLHLGVACALPLYGLVHNADEATTDMVLPPPLISVGARKTSPDSSSQFRTVLHTFWQCAQQRVVWQLLLFNCVLFFCGFFELADARRAVQFWTHDTAPARLVRNCAGDAAFVVVLLLWRRFGIAVPWRTLTVAVIVGWCLTNAVLSSLVIFDVFRAPWVALVSWTLRAPFRVLMLLVPFVPTIEIAPPGTEGTTYALLACVQSVVKMLAAEIAQAIVRGWPAIQFNTKVLAQSMDATKHAHFYALLVGTMGTLCAALGVGLLPKQKLDAQQLRAYGGYSTWPLVVLIVGFVVAFPYVFYLQIVRL